MHVVSCENYLHILKHRHVPVYSVSSIFRPEQVFFKWYGRQYGRVLNCFTHFFVQNEISKDLLEKIHIKDVTVVGDTRFDRVLQIKEAAKHLPIVETFKQDAQVFVAGSSWPPDEEIFIPYFMKHPKWKMIIAPHVIGEDHLRQIEKLLEGRKVIRYTKGDVPVFFGPNNQRFQEAQGLKAAGGGFDFETAEAFERQMDIFLKDAEKLRVAGEKAGLFVQGLAGATEKVLSAVDL